MESLDLRNFECVVVRLKDFVNENGKVSGIMKNWRRNRMTCTAVFLLLKLYQQYIFCITSNFVVGRKE